LRGSIVLAVPLGFVAVLAQPLIPLLYGEKYAASAGLFLALTLVVLFDLITSSLFLVALPLNRPRILAAADWLRVGVLGGVGWLLIPVAGGIGAVWARGAARVVGTAYSLVALRRAAMSAPDDAGMEPATPADVTL
jgi:O-antigen/teichoic acid export membrane protein